MSRAGSMKRWTLVPSPNPAARVRLFCFPYAGGGASIFNTWPRGLPAEVEVVGVQPPGREARIGETPIGNLHELADAIHRELTPLLDRPFVLFGHSNGGLMAFEVARRLRRAGGPMPELLVASGRPAPQVTDDEPPIHALPYDEFIAALRRYNGTPEEILANAEIMELLEPVLRADFSLGETYRYDPEPPLDVPITAFGGERDDEVPRDHVEAWREQTTGAFHVQMFPGDHFFLNSDRDQVLAALSRELRPVVARLG
ncbi:thioesterase II family protein [Longimicrobium sp.]|uniref:thioesterase II family protein n=1 Tax=Longimicrobium sp. TaxID=2029185 RepID=UPI002ED7E0CB